MTHPRGQGIQFPFCVLAVLSGQVEIQFPFNKKNPFEHDKQEDVVQCLQFVGHDKQVNVVLFK